MEPLLAGAALRARSVKKKEFLTVTDMWSTGRDQPCLLSP